MSEDVVLRVEDLVTEVRTPRGVIRPVDGVSFELRRGEALGLVGESGSGKSLTCLSLIRVLPPSGRIVAGRVLIDGEDVVQASARRLRRIRGGKIGMILQDPLTSLNPVYTVGEQIAESVRKAAPDANRRDVRRRVVDALRSVHIPDADRRAGEHPHQFSGGMRQRVTAAIAAAREPDVLIADEPTTALDVTTQHRFLHMLQELRTSVGMALVFVSHDLGVVGELCQRIAVMYAGRIVEIGPADQLLRAPAHPYTQALVRALPDLTGERQRRLYQIGGEPPDPHRLGGGCRFAPRCPDVHGRCWQAYPGAFTVAGGQTAACWLHAEDADAGVGSPGVGRP